MRKNSVFISLALGSYAQRARYNQFYSYLNYEQLDKAKESIDIAVTNEKMNMTKHGTIRTDLSGATRMKN